MSYIEFSNIGKKYKNNNSYSVEKFNLEVIRGEFIAFVGPSGCGKTTTLRMIAGLEEITEGEIIIDEVLVNEVAPKDRDIAMVFQNYALYPHMTVAENITCGMEARKVSKSEITQKLEWASDILGLNNYLNKRPKDLSGGQKQRVALGRAMVRNPKVFLMDEPLSNLDAKLRTSMRNEITKLHRQLGSTTIYVTHDQVEAMTMADRIVIMKSGIIQQIGTPKEVYAKPTNKFVAGFIGAPQMNFFDIEVNGSTFELCGCTLTIPEGLQKSVNISGKVTIGIRPEFFTDTPLEIEVNKDGRINAIIDNVEELGNEVILHLVYGNHRFLAKLAARTDYQIGDKIKLAVNMNKICFFDASSEVRLENI